MIEHGLYFIANDKTYELAIAFLNSVRTFEPLLPICFIPYNRECQQVADLAVRYNFSVWEDETALLRCDEISQRFHNAILGQYRKLCIWQGPYRQFAYIDVDSILLSPLEGLWSFLIEYDIVCATSDNPANRKFVWRDSLSEADTTFDHAYSANTGVLLSRREVLSWEMIDRAVEQSSNLVEHMELLCVEQAFLNYLIVTSGRRYSSLRRIARETRRRDIPLHLWSGHFDGDLLNSERLPLVIHWAGEWQYGVHLRSPLWRHFRYLPDERR
jgi:hypothetical protein